MMTKTELFAELNDKENRVNATAHIAVYKYGNGNTSVIVSQQGAPNICLSNHKSDTNTAAAVAKYTTWLNEWVADQAETAQAAALEEDRQRQIESDRKAGRPVDEEGNDTREWCGNDIQAAHAEALEVNAVIDEATRRAACFSDLDSATPNAINHAINYVRNSLLGLNRYNARFIVKMMIATSNLAKKARIKAAEKHREMLARCATATTEQISNEIPF